MHRLPLLLLLATTTSHADPSRFELTAGAGASIPVADDRIGTRAVERIAFALQLGAHVSLSLPLELGEFHFQPMGQLRTSDTSLELIPELAITIPIGTRVTLAPLAGIGAVAISDDDSCINLHTCDAYNNFVGLKAVLRAGVELAYRRDHLAVWVRPLVVERFYGGESMTFATGLAGAGVVF